MIRKCFQTKAVMATYDILTFKLPFLTKKLLGIMYWNFSFSEYPHWNIIFFFLFSWCMWTIKYECWIFYFMCFEPIVVFDFKRLINSEKMTKKPTRKQSISLFDFQKNIFYNVVSELYFSNLLVEHKNWNPEPW